MINKTVYLAGPISGKGYDEVVGAYQDKSKALLDMGYQVLCPMTGKTYLRNELEFKSHGYASYPVSTNHAIFERDRWMVQQSDIVLADLSGSGSRVSIGTVMELAWASMLGKHTIVVMDDDNIHQHAFVIEAADIVFPRMQDAYKYLYDLVRGV